MRQHIGLTRAVCCVGAGCLLAPHLPPLGSFPFPLCSVFSQSQRPVCVSMAVSAF